MRASNDYVAWTPHTTREQRTVPVHPADGGASRGQATTSDFYGCALRPRLGIAGSLGTDSFRIKIGLDNMLNMGITNLKKQNLPDPPYESYAFCRFSPDPVTFKPFVGFESELAKVLFGAELGITYSSFRLSKGHYRWCDYETIEKYYLGSGPGVFAGLMLAFRADRNTYIGAMYGFENYFIQNRQDIQCHTISLLFRKTFW
jgi:hypothetical protein